MKVLALIGTRNEEAHIARCLDDWRRHGCDVILIDNDSQDRTIEIARRYLKSGGLLSIERLPWKGWLSMTDQLYKKQEVIRSVDHRWVIHADADEWLCSPPGLPLVLAEALSRVDEEGYTCVNFNEFVFVPKPDEDFANSNYTELMLTYYFFQPIHEPSYPRLVRAWRRELDVDNLEFGGHTLRGEGIKRYPIDFILRHYIALSVEHVWRKYLARQFDPNELARGWHGNRLNLKRNQFLLRSARQLRSLPHWNSRDFDRSMPCNKHFWEPDFW